MFDSTNTKKSQLDNISNCPQFIALKNTRNDELYLNKNSIRKLAYDCDKQYLRINVTGCEEETVKMSMSADQYKEFMDVNFPNTNITDVGNMNIIPKFGITC